nr:hypothetical protein [Tanacetum cinerariifolium]
ESDLGSWGCSERVRVAGKRGKRGFTGLVGKW